MAKYLVSVQEQYRVDTEKEVETFINQAKKAPNYELKKYTSEYKESKSKGEVIDSWFRVTLVKQFTTEKEPDCYIMPTYGNSDSDEGDFE